ncbi:MAG: hypothetical protein F6J89_18410 [Symploca sp. SIO1C4]|uniref:FG-GAP repeat protein n=1 Tax=Symploca sp. SIO1C4 TaxID=2607765 RepID=A0A6B3NJZ2_9CYAN|nr:hypothetical protein [Symploca sp. SIO1C4]
MENQQFNLSELNGLTGFTIKGINVGDLSGFSISSAGDINGDGYDDLIVGVPFADPSLPNAGESYVVFGGYDRSSTVDLAQLGNTGLRITGINVGDLSHSFVSSAGDFNNDGYDDLIIGSPLSNPGSPIRPNAGKSYVVFGSSDSSVVDLTVSDSENILAIEGMQVADFSGSSVSSAGDFNGDGYDDVIIGARSGGNLDQGESYVIFGGNSGVTKDLQEFEPGHGLLIKGIDVSDLSGYSVSSAGDFNADGYDDVIIGAPLGDDGSPDAGESYVVFGRSSGGILELEELTPNDGLLIKGIGVGDQSGYSVSGAGDVNGDGYDDVIIGAPFADGNAPDSGESYVVFGGNSGSVDLSQLDTGEGFVVKGVNAADLLGYSVSGAGDINGDGFDDVLIGAPLSDNNMPDAGATYLIFGSQDLNGVREIDLANLGYQGMVFNGIDAGDLSGRAVSGAGDINSDGYDDLLIGAPFAEGGSVDAGETYVVFGDASFGKPPGAELPSIVVEAEDMTLDTYRIESRPEEVASGGEVISLLQPGYPDDKPLTGTASTEFTGPTGVYDLSVAYFDEIDGYGRLEVFVNDILVDFWFLGDIVLDAEEPNLNNGRTRTINGLLLSEGATIKIQGFVENEEYARVDYIGFDPVSNSADNSWIDIASLIG